MRRCACVAHVNLFAPKFDGAVVLHNIAYGVVVGLLQFFVFMPSSFYFFNKLYGLFPIIELAVLAQAVGVVLRLPFKNKEGIDAVFPFVAIAPIFVGKTHGIAYVSYSGVVRCQHKIAALLDIVYAAKNMVEAFQQAGCSHYILAWLETQGVGYSELLQCSRHYLHDAACSYLREGGTVETRLGEPNGCQ